MIGQRLAHYEILGLLGKGGMGEVYRARDTKLGREVALKILPPEVAEDPERLARFRREAELVARLNHPGIITIHSIDEADGRTFFTMELVDGIPLDRLLTSSKLDIERCITLAERIAAALASAHDAGLVHRDLKPANILVGPDDRPKILDFGLAKGDGTMEEIVGTDATELITGDHQIVGTIPYMSPEQVQSRPVDARSDLFSLGVILFEMVGGRRPFHAESDAALLSAILRDAAPDLSAIRDGTPLELGQLVRECLEKKPENRPGTAREIARRLRSLREHSSGSHSDIQPAPPVRRNPWPWLAAAILVLVVTGGLWLRGREPATTEAGPSVAVLPFAFAGDDDTAYLGDALTERLINQLSGIEGLRVMARSTVFRIDSSDPMAAGEELGVATVVTGRLRLRQDRVAMSVELVRVDDGSQLWGERLERSLDELIDLEADIARQIAGGLSVELSGTQRAELEERATENAVAWRAYLRGRQLWNERTPESIAAAEVALTEAVTLDPEFALAHATLSMTHGVSWQYIDPDLERKDRLSRLHAERALELDPELSDAHAAMGLVHFETDWDWDAAETSYLRAIELDPDNMTARQWYGEFLGEQGRFEEAWTSFEAAMRIDPLSPVLHVAYAYTLMAGGDPDRAFATVDALLERDPTSWVGLQYLCVLSLECPPDHPRAADAMEATLAYSRVAGWTEEQRARTRELFAEHGRPGLHVAMAEVEQARSPGSIFTKWVTILAESAMGHLDRVVELAREAVEERSPNAIWFGSNPTMRRSEVDPRYRELLTEHDIVTGLPVW